MGSAIALNAYGRLPISLRRVKRFDLLPFDFQHFDAQFCMWRAVRK
jgi:hypothetical protein